MYIHTHVHANKHTNLRLLMWYLKGLGVQVSTVKNMKCWFVYVRSKLKIVTYSIISAYQVWCNKWKHMSSLNLYIHRTSSSICKSILMISNYWVGHIENLNLCSLNLTILGTAFSVFTSLFITDSFFYVM